MGETSLKHLSSVFKHELCGLSDLRLVFSHTKVGAFSPCRLRLTMTMNCSPHMVTLEDPTQDGEFDSAMCIYNCSEGLISIMAGVYHLPGECGEDICLDYLGH
jgi:hypothetical protein